MLNVSANTPLVGDRYRLRCLYHSGTLLAEYTATVDRTAAEGGVLPITFHDVGANLGSAYNIATALFQQVVDHAVSLGLPSYLPDDVFPQQTPLPAIVRSVQDAN